MTDKMIVTVSPWSLKGTAEGETAIKIMATTIKLGMVTLVILVALLATDVKSSISYAGTFAFSAVKAALTEEPKKLAPKRTQKLVEALRPTPTDSQINYNYQELENTNTGFSSP